MGGTVPDTPISYMLKTGGYNITVHDMYFYVAPTSN